MTNKIVSDKEKELLDLITEYRDYLLYVIGLLREKNVDLSVEKKMANYDKTHKIFTLPNFLERCYLISIRQYLSLVDAYYYEFKMKTVSQEKKFTEYFAKFNKTNFIKSANGRVAKKVRSKYFWVYYVFYYFKIAYKVRFDDSFLYALFYYLKIPPAVLIYAKKHAENHIRNFKKKNLDLTVLLMDEKLKEKIEEVRKCF
ncbi:hypothetical protein DESAMIL20_678 [Desulfurella amilsii]|uniref:Uncharacterized protein n=1 Tax=Desulfurella amilsii TaxID=1562698 RepID=A0A1X4XYA9_9BACT|nr:hypothetical protein [Desulfurella amilsii]OSS42494.1 hypothetical protein DESAMIL20_678 [Desulfurella amilsii]